MCTTLFLTSCYPPNKDQSISRETDANKEITKLQKCPEQPQKPLQVENVETITFEQKTITKSGNISQTDMIGYQFQAQAGQILNYQTDNELCIWIYSPDQKLIHQPKLPKSGEYIMQISTISTSKEFELKITLDSLSTKFESNDTSSLPHYSFKDFPKSSCGDSLPEKEAKYPVKFYAVDIAYSEFNLKQAKKLFCQDAFVKSIEGERLIQVASFRTIQKSKKFADFVRRKFEHTKVKTDSKTIVKKDIKNYVQ